MRLTLLQLLAISLTSVVCWAQEPLSDGGGTPAAIPLNKDAVTAPVPPPTTAPPKGACDSYTMQNLPALDLQQKTCYFAGQLVTGSAIFGAAFFGAISMAQDSPKEWPQGAKGFGYQFGTRYAQGMLKSTVTYGVGALLREDPRPKPPYAIGASHQHIPHTNAWARLGSSLLRVVWAHHEDDRDTVAFSRIAGSLASGFIQMAYLPPSQNNAATAFKGAGTALGGYALDSVWTEFQGDFFGWLGRRIATGDPK